LTLLEPYRSICSTFANPLIPVSMDHRRVDRVEPKQVRSHAQRLTHLQHAIDIRDINDVALVLSRPLDVIDDEHFARGTRGFEFQPKLFL
jgi:hypothetical protein